MAWQAERELYLADAAETEALGAAIARGLRPGLVVYLRGDLGSGKTTLVRGLLHQLGHTGAVKSPTYTLVEDYVFADLAIYHFDLYRLGDPEELELIGIRDYLDGRSCCLVEWPERGAGALPPADLEIELRHRKTGRDAHLRGVTMAGQVLLASFDQVDGA